MAVKDRGRWERGRLTPALDEALEMSERENLSEEGYRGGLERRVRKEG
jgi:hypothetical protein